MKRLFTTLTMMLVAFMANAQSCPDNNHPHVIDLGLPSGTKWACCNVGATTPENCGGYYAWGETKEKEMYDWATYIHCDGSMKNCYDLGSDIAGTEYDVAHVRWGGSWVIPSQGQIEELTNKCSFTWTTMNGVDGAQFTGPNGGTIFLPSADIRWDGFLECLIHGGYYWSSTQSPYSYDSFRLCFDSWGGSCGGDNHGLGLTIRPVISKTNNGTNNIAEEAYSPMPKVSYDLYGRQLRGRPEHGLYIQNGKKRVVR